MSMDINFAWPGDKDHDILNELFLKYEALEKRFLQSEIISSITNRFRGESVDEEKELLDLEPEVPCEIQIFECGNESTWYMLKPCCDDTMALCEEHKLIAEWILEGDLGLMCATCGTRDLDVKDFRFEKR